MSKIICPECGVRVHHVHGYLESHTVTVARGNLNVGVAICDGSNSRPDVSLRTVTYTGCCDICGDTVIHKDTEAWPGSLTQYGGSRAVPHDCCGIDQNGTESEPVVSDVVVHDNYVIAE